MGKLVVNLSNAVEAITDMDNEESEKIVRAAEDEAKPILEAAGIKWIS